MLYSLRKGLSYSENITQLEREGAKIDRESPIIVEMILITLAEGSLSSSLSGVRQAVPHDSQDGDLFHRVGTSY